MRNTLKHDVTHAMNYKNLNYEIETKDCAYLDAAVVSHYEL